MQAQPHQRTQRNHHKLIDGEKILANLQRPLQARKARCKHFIRAKPPLHRVVHRERQAEGSDQLVQLWHTGKSP